jgi:acetyl-CoA C-acetyltransferase
MGDVVIVSAGRTPFGKFGGMLKELTAVDLGSQAVKAVLGRIPSYDPREIDELYMGVAVLAGTASVAARQILFLTGLPATTPSLTLDRACCSSTTCVGLAMRNIRAGIIDAAIAGGMEAMSQTPLIARGVRWGTRLGGFMMEEPLFLRNPILNIPLAVGAAEVALEHGVSREEQDEWAIQSHRRYFAALEQNRFSEEIQPVTVNLANGTTVQMEHDEAPRKDTSLEKLSSLPTVYGSKTVTAGNAPGLNDGASALLLMARQKQENMGLGRLATVLYYTNIAGDPLSSPYLPALAIRKALRATGIGLEELKRIEINEAFAATPLVSTKVLSDGDNRKMEHLRSITNVNGGAVAIGHPTGASGGRILMTLLHELRRIGGGFGAAAICGGYGQSDAIILRVD